jgi:hypothetical protein
LSSFVKYTVILFFSSVCWKDFTLLFFVGGFVGWKK